MVVSVFQNKTVSNWANIQFFADRQFSLFSRFSILSETSISRKTEVQENICRQKFIQKFTQKNFTFVSTLKNQELRNTQGHQFMNGDEQFMRSFDLLKTLNS